MFANPGFTFKNTKGTYSLDRVPEAIIIHGNKAHSGRTITATYEHGYTTVYANGASAEESLALKFAGINIHKDREIIDFCNAYGLLFPNFIDAYEADNNDYLFLNASKDDVTHSRLASQISGLPLFDFQSAVIRMRKTLQLYDGISTEDYHKIIDSLLFFCFEHTDLIDEDDDECELIPDQEGPRFNYYFRKFMADLDYELSDPDYADHSPEEIDTLNKRIRLFLDALSNYAHDEDFGNGMVYHSIDYEDMLHCMWGSLHDFVSGVTSQCDILEVDALEGVRLSIKLEELDINAIFDDCSKLITLAKAFLSDFFNATLCHITPRMQFENGVILPNLDIGSLHDAMYLELFFKLNPYTRLHKCANPTCNSYFELSSDNSKKIYCSTRCAQLMAKRKQREREKQKND